MERTLLSAALDLDLLKAKCRPTWMLSLIQGGAAVHRCDSHTKSRRLQPSGGGNPGSQLAKRLNASTVHRSDFAGPMSVMTSRIAVKTMDELARGHLRAVDNFLASLTPQQRELAKVRTLRPNELTSHQQSLANETERTTPKGLTPAQAEQYTLQATLEENREHSQKEFQRGTAFGIGCCIAILILLGHC